MRPAKAPDPEKWVLCLGADTFPNKSVMLAHFGRDKTERKSYPLWYGLASRYPQWEVYRAKDGSDRWWIQAFQYGQRRTLIKDVPFLMVGAWYSHFMNEKKWTDVHFVYEEASDAS